MSDVTKLTDPELFAQLAEAIEEGDLGQAVGADYVCGRLRAVGARLALAEELLTEWVDNYTEPKGHARLQFTMRVMDFVKPGCDTFEEWKSGRKRVYEVSTWGVDRWEQVPASVEVSEDSAGNLVCKTAGGTSRFTPEAWRVRFAEAKR